MDEVPLPRATTREHDWSAAIVRRLDAQNDLLTRILDRLPDKPDAAQEDAAAGTVELREPVSQNPAADPDNAAGGEVREPAASSAPPARTHRPTAPKPSTKAPGRAARKKE